MPETEIATDTTWLYFVRHGETEYNRQGIVQGRGIDSTLNAQGRQQAEALGHRLKGVSFSSIYASPLRRTRQTAAILAQHHRQTPVQYLSDLEEMAWGIYEGEPPSEERDRVLDAMKKRWREGAHDEPIEGGESIRQVQERALRAVDHITAQENGSNVLIVTHGRFLRVVLASILDEYGLHKMHKLPHSNTAVNRIEYHGNRFSADLLNCTAHLDSAS